MWNIIWPFIFLLSGIFFVIMGLRMKKRQGFSETEKKYLEKSGITLEEAEKNRKRNAKLTVRIGLFSMIFFVVIEIYWLLHT